MRDVGDILNGVVHYSDVNMCPPIRDNDSQGKYLRRTKGQISEVQGRLHKIDIGICNVSDWLVKYIGILLDNDFTKGHGLLWMDFDIILINVTVEGALHVARLGIKVEDNLGGFEVSQK